MLCYYDQLERVIAVEKVLAIRGQGNPDTQLGDSSIRVRRTPIINFNAKKFVDLIICSDDAFSEPPLTCSLTTTEVRKIIDSPTDVPKWPCHTQSVERVFKMVTEASAKYFSHEKRDGGIRGQEASRRMMSKNDSKQDLFDLVTSKR